MSAVYTALIGGYERLNEQPMAEHSSIPFICFTDDASLVSDTWKIEVVDPAFERDPVRSARRLKILGHELLDDVAASLWIDNSVVLRTPPEEILEPWLDGIDVAMPLHSYRKSVMDEFDAVLDSGFDDPARVYEQMHHYLETAPDVLDEVPLWSAIIARRRCRQTDEMCEQWFEHVLRYSRRDQLSVRMALHRSPSVRLREVTLDNHESPHHQWPVMTMARPGTAERDPASSVKPLVARLHRSEAQVVELSARIGEAEATAAAATSDAESAQRVTDGLRAQLDDARRQLDDARRELDALRGSRTWRTGRAIARIVRPFGARVL